MKNKYDLVIAYRIYPKISKIPAYHPEDKYKLSELCLKSFTEAIKNLNYKIYVILDKCPEEYYSLFRQYIPEDRMTLISTPAIGNGMTFLEQLNLLCNQDESEVCYFAEDDYFYFPDAFEKMLKVIDREEVDFLTPYNHPEYYTMSLHNYKSKNLLIEDENWRTISTTTMTFMAKKHKLKEAYKVFETYSRNNYDNSMWMALTKYKIRNPILFLKSLSDLQLLKIFVKGWLYNPLKILFGRKFRLYVPDKTLATHMDNLGLPKGYNWEAIFRECDEK